MPPALAFRLSGEMRVSRLLLPLLLVQLAAAADLYATLGVGRSADGRALKKAYRKMALQNHPDKQASRSDAQKKAATADFVAASNAYEVLSNPDKRRLYDRHYDRHGEAGLEARQQARQAGAAGGGAFRAPLEVFEAMFGTRGGFGSVFGGSGRGGGGVRGGGGGGGGGSKMFMDARGDVHRQAGGGAAAQEARAQQQQQQRRRQQQQQQQQQQRRRQQQQAHHYPQQAAQADAEQRTRQAEFDAR